MSFLSSIIVKKAIQVIESELVSHAPEMQNKLLQEAGMVFDLLLKHVNDKLQNKSE